MRLMEPISQKLYELESEQAREQEDEVRPGPPPEVAARKPAALLGGGEPGGRSDHGPSLGFTAPDRVYPLVTHPRGVAARLVSGLPWRVPLRRRRFSWGSRLSL